MDVFNRLHKCYKYMLEFENISGYEFLTMQTTEFRANQFDLRIMRLNIYIQMGWEGYVVHLNKKNDNCLEMITYFHLGKIYYSRWAGGSSKFL
jgi:hypothetical protein